MVSGRAGRGRGGFVRPYYGATVSARGALAALAPGQSAPRVHDRPVARTELNRSRERKPALTRYVSEGAKEFINLNLGFAGGTGPLHGQMERLCYPQLVHEELTTRW